MTTTDQRCPNCGHAWTDHDQRDERLPEGRPCCMAYGGMGDPCGCAALPPGRQLAATPEPVTDRVVAMLRYPMPASGLAKLIKGLERTYGKGLVIVTDGDDWRDGWMTVALPRGDE